MSFTEKLFRRKRDPNRITVDAHLLMDAIDSMDNLYDGGSGGTTRNYETILALLEQHGWHQVEVYNEDGYVRALKWEQSVGLVPGYGDGDDHPG